MPRLTSLFLALPLLAASGCIIIEDDPYRAFYETCAYVNDCTSSATACEQLTGVWEGDRTTTDYICTSDCIFGSDCPGANGYASGVCYDQDGNALTPNVCLEPCSDDIDCDVGFACADFAGTRFCLPY